jgi:hypothetical protein
VDPTLVCRIQVALGGQKRGRYGRGMLDREMKGVCIAWSGLPVMISLVGRKLPAAAYKPEVRKCVAKRCPANNRASLIMYSAKQGE